MAGSGGGSPRMQVAGPTQFGEVFPAVVISVLWVITWITSGALAAAQTSWIFFIALPLAGWAVLMRLRFDRDHLERTIGPFRQRVRLDALASIEHKHTGGWRSQGMIFVKDTYGHRVGIYVGRFDLAAEWSAVLLDAAERAHVTVQPRAYGILRSAVANAGHQRHRP